MEALMILLMVIGFVTTVAGQDCPRKCRSCQNNVTDCSKMNLLNPPKDFSKYTRTVDLDGNGLRVLGRNAFPRLPVVEVLKVRSNKIRLIKKDSFKSIPKLMTLDLSNNNIARMYSKSFDGVKNLRTLTLATNRIATVTGILDTLPSLFQLNLANNRIRVIHAKTFYKNTKLHYLDLRYNSLTRIHRDSFKNLKYLRYLFLNNNPLVNVPQLNIGSLVLQLVDFSSCKLKKIPQGLPPSVTDLRLGNNQIEEIRKNDVANITNLRLLALNNNKIHRVTFMAFSNLKKLQEIWLRENRLIYIPRGLPDNLRKLYMDSNQVVTIERVLFTNKSQLEYLTVENNRVQTIKPGALSRLKVLKFLNLQGNTLKNISSGMFANIGNLSVLTLSNNPVQKIERGAFKNLNNLTHLYMSYIPADENFLLEDNFLPAMPQLQKLELMGSQSLAKSLIQILEDTPVMRNLTEIDLTFNDIETLPSSIKSRFPNIRALSIDGNYLICDDKLLWLAKWMNSSDVKFFSYEDPQCEEPYRNKGKLLTAVPAEDYVAIQRQYPQYSDYGYNYESFKSEENQQDHVQKASIPEKKTKDKDAAPKKQVTKTANLLPIRKVALATKGLNPAGQVARASSQTQKTTNAPLVSKKGREDSSKSRKETDRRGRRGHKRRRKRRHRNNDGERKRRRRRRRGHARKRRHHRNAAVQKTPQKT